MTENKQDIDEQPGFSDFDYNTIQGIPEQVLRVGLLERRLLTNAHDRDVPVLEIGIGSGDITTMLTRHFTHVTCVDSSRKHCDRVRQLLERQGRAAAEIVCAAIEEVQLPAHRFRHIVLMNMLEHLEFPVAVLKRLKPLLKNHGTIYITVPLAHSIHRLLGVEMGMISHPEELAESDIHFGHYRVYTPTLLRDHLEAAGLTLNYELPIYLKPLPTSRLTPLPMELHRALFALGEKFPQFASYLYVETGL